MDPTKLKNASPLTGPFLEPRANPFHLPIRTSDEEGCARDTDCGGMFRKPYSGAFSDAIFGARFRRMVRFFRIGCFPTPSPSFGAILGKRYC